MRLPDQQAAFALAAGLALLLSACGEEMDRRETADSTGVQAIEANGALLSPKDLGDEWVVTRVHPTETAGDVEVCGEIVASGLATRAMNRPGAAEARGPLVQEWIGAFESPVESTRVLQRLTSACTSSTLPPRFREADVPPAGDESVLFETTIPEDDADPAVYHESVYAVRCGAIVVVLTQSVLDRRDIDRTALLSLIEAATEKAGAFLAASDLDGDCLSGVETGADFSYSGIPLSSWNERK